MSASCWAGCLPPSIPWAKAGDGVYQRSAAVAACRRLAADKLIEGRLTSRDPREREHALDILCTLNPADAARHAARTTLLLQDPTWSVRHAAVDALAGRGGVRAGILVAAPGLTAALKRLLEREDAAVQLTAAATLSRVDGACDRRVAAMLSDRALVLRAVAGDGESLRYAGAELRGERCVVLRAVRQCPSALRHASEELRGDPAVVAAAAASPGGRDAVLRHAAQDVRDRLFVADDLQGYEALVAGWRRVEESVFATPAPAAIVPGKNEAGSALRVELAHFVRRLAEELQAPARWGKAVVLLDAIASSKPGVCTGKLRFQVATGALVTVIKLGNRRFKLDDFGPTLAAAVGESEYGPAASRKLFRAQAFALSVLSGRVSLPSVSDWADIFLARLVGQAQSPDCWTFCAGANLEVTVVSPDAAVPDAQDISSDGSAAADAAMPDGAPEIARPLCNSRPPPTDTMVGGGAVPGSVAMKLLQSSQFDINCAKSNASAASTAVPPMDSDSEQSVSSPWATEVAVPEDASHGSPEGLVGADDLNSNATDGDRVQDVASGLVREVAEAMMLKVPASTVAPPRALAAACCVIGLACAGMVSLRDLWGDCRAREELEAVVARAAAAGLLPTRAPDGSPTADAQQPDAIRAAAVVQAVAGGDAEALRADLAAALEAIDASLG